MTPSTIEARRDAVCRLLEDSGLLDVASYCAAAGLKDAADAARHYLVEGWHANLEPNPHFEGRFLYPYYRSAGFDGPPALTFLMLREAGWPVYATRTQALEVATIVGSSGLFDPVLYAARAGGLANLDPALHYVLVGEQQGLAPSEGFNPEYYRDRYADVVQRGFNRLGHYAVYGRSEGRRGISIAETLRFDRERLDGARETILLFVHEASRTGAPIIAYHIAGRLRQKYNVVAVLLEAGPLVDDFTTCCTAVVGPIARSHLDDVEARQLVRRLCDVYQPLYAIANSIETRAVLPALAQSYVPVVTLVHEFASYTRPLGSMGQAIDWSTHVVFPAGVVAAAAEREHSTLRGRRTYVLPQGACPGPAGRRSSDTPRHNAVLVDLARAKERDGALIVFGCGSVHLRKGVDLFISCAAAVAAAGPKRSVRFLWTGAGYQPDTDASYSCYLAEQLRETGLGSMVTILDAIDDVEPAYAIADVFLLSSRLDPLPNVAIDAALRGIPIVCFEGATGIADLLSGDRIAGRGVVSHLDVHAAASRIVGMVNDDSERIDIGEATRRLAEATFDTDRYVRRLDEIGNDAVRIMRQRKEDFTTLREDPLFDANVYVHRRQPVMTRDEAITGFLARWHAVGLVNRSVANWLFRRPCPGFHPQVYAHANRDRYDVSLINPLAHFIRSGRPEGPWCHEVIEPHLALEPGASTGLRVALHGHFFYPELADDLMRRLSVNRSRCDLLFTTDDERKARRLRDATVDYDRGEVIVRLVPNRGRDIGPLVWALTQGGLGDYDVVGHVHSKRSLAIEDGTLGESWREFLWEHLVGGCHPMMDRILERFAGDRTLGLVFPDDPHLPDWDDNELIAAELAQRMTLPALPPFFDFPVGTMFWARVNALQPLLRLGLDWTDYPAEPIPIDGTILHALERLLPFVAAHAGYRYASAYVPGSTR